MIETLLTLVNPIHASIPHCLVAVSAPNPGVDLIANCSAVDFAVNLNSLTQGAAGELAGEKADFHE